MNNPCKECIVVSMCKDYCDDFKNFVCDIFLPFGLLTQYNLESMCNTIRFVRGKGYATQYDRLSLTTLEEAYHLVYVTINKKEIRVYDTDNSTLLKTRSLS